MNDNTLNKITKLERELNSSERIQINHELRWHQDLPNKPGVYVIREKGNIIYVGETGNMKKRMSDLNRTQNHTFRRTIGEKLFSNRKDYVKATSKRKYPDKLEEELNQWISKNCNVSYITLDFGRKEVEEYYQEKYELYNKRKKRR